MNTCANCNRRIASGLSPALCGKCREKLPEGHAPARIYIRKRKDGTVSKSCRNHRREPHVGYGTYGSVEYVRFDLVKRQIAAAVKKVL